MDAAQRLRLALVAGIVLVLCAVLLPGPLTPDTGLEAAAQGVLIFLFFAGLAHLAALYALVVSFRHGRTLPPSLMIGGRLLLPLCLLGDLAIAVLIYLGL